MNTKVYAIAGVAALGVLWLINQKARVETEEQPRGPEYLVYNMPYDRNLGDPNKVLPGDGTDGTGSGGVNGTCKLCRVFDQSELLSPLAAAMRRFAQNTYSQTQAYQASVQQYIQKTMGNWLQ